MTALLDIATHEPEEFRIPIEQAVIRAGDRRVMPVFRRYLGLDTVHRIPDGRIASLHAAAAGSLTLLRGREHHVRYVVFAYSTSNVTLHGELPPEELCRELGLPNAVAFSLTQHACATGLLALDLVGRMLADEDDPDALGLILTGDRPYPNQNVIPGSTIVGECTAAVLVGAEGEHDRMLSYAAHTRGQFADGVPPHAVPPEFFAEHQEMLARTMREAARAAGTDLAELPLILPHNVNTTVWKQLCETEGLAPERILLDNVPRTAHCFSADSFINHVTAREQGRLKPGDLYLMAAVGLGATYAAAVFRH